MHEIPLLVIAGVTASGKTALGAACCRQLGGEVVSADSMQIYRGMEIATAVPSESERQGVPHHLLGFLSPAEEFSVADFAARARPIITDIAARGRLPVLVGGTGLYLSALLHNIRFEGFAGDKKVRERLVNEAQALGGETLFKRLLLLDPELAKKLHPNNLSRVIRALEVQEITGVPMSLHQRKALEQGGCYRTLALALGFRERENSTKRINTRVDEMMKNGLLEEARRFYQSFPGKTAAAAIGYKELRPYLQGEAPLADCLTNLKTRTRQYAKRQMTWLRRESAFHWLFVDDYSDFAALTDEALRQVAISKILQDFSHREREL